MSFDPNRALDALLELMRALDASDDLEPALRLVATTALELLPGDHASVRVLDEARERLLSAARVGAGSDDAPMELRATEGVAGWVVQTGRPARVDDVERDPRYVPPPPGSHPVRSLLVVPLSTAHHVVGVLGASSPRPAAFDERDEALASLLAACAVGHVERARLRRLAMTDPLTLAYNRRYLDERLPAELERARRTGQPLGLLALDLDHFKRVNDRFGHATGDRVLRAVADRIRASVRRHDVLVRTGGEELVVLMPGASAAVVEPVAERVRRALAADPLDVAPEPIRLTVSIGAAVWDGIDEPAQLLARADAALYEAKRLGRDRVVMANPTQPAPAPASTEL
ncbi:MAG: sensor domain-containing diguanylate cyclase [Myxococcales bacterium]|nr:sensor domain-containing diguanylate cyclase [Myxococcales bacterium]